MSELVPKIDFKYPPKLMHQDVAKVIGSTRKKGDLVTDIIMEVCLLDGKKKLLYIHIEVQSSPTDAFGEKMFKPFYRIRSINTGKDSSEYRFAVVGTFINNCLSRAKTEDNLYCPTIRQNY